MKMFLAGMKQYQYSKQYPKNIIKQYQNIPKQYHFFKENV